MFGLPRGGLLLCPDRPPWRTMLPARVMLLSRRLAETTRRCVVGISTSPRQSRRDVTGPDCDSTSSTVARKVAFRHRQSGSRSRWAPSLRHTRNTHFKPIWRHRLGGFAMTCLGPRSRSLFDTPDDLLPRRKTIASSVIGDLRPAKARKWMRRLGFMFTSFLALALLLPSVSTKAAEIWLAGLAPTMFSGVHNGDTSDYLSLFQQGAPWPRAASVVRVFKIYSQFVNRASDAELRTAFTDLRRRNIALALEAGPMTAGANCGHGEGYGGPLTAGRIAERIRQSGGDVQYLAMDEPLWFGHQSSGANACHTPIPEIARDVAANVAAFKRMFPAAQVGDIEPIGRAEPAEWTDELMQWAQAYRDAAGVPLAFFDADVYWAGPWQRQLTLLAARLHAAGIRLGVIYDGDRDDQTGQAWTRHAEQRFAAVESGLGLTPDQAILQTWMPQPDHMLPETQPGTMTWLVDRYLAAPTHLTLHRVGGRLEGELTYTTGHPLAGVPVTVSAETPGDWGTPAVHERSGLVPPEAATAVLALRINAECGCSGPADIGIGLMSYHDDRTSQTVQQTFKPVSAPDGAAALARFQAQPGQPITQGTPHFPVTVNDPFTVQVPMRTDLHSAGTGYVALIFLDEQKKEVERVRLSFEPAERPIGTATTDAQGRFSFLASPEVLQRASGFRVKFYGTPQYRMAEAGVH
jgi:hypothetical protein